MLVAFPKKASAVVAGVVPALIASPAFALVCFYPCITYTTLNIYLADTALVDWSFMSMLATVVVVVGFGKNGRPTLFARCCYLQHGQLFISTYKTDTSVLQ